MRPQGATKGRAVETVLGAEPGTALIAIGDDRTDEDMFAALPEGAVGITVGDRVSRAEWRLSGVGAVRELLARVAGERDTLPALTAVQ